MSIKRGYGKVLLFSKEYLKKKGGRI